MHKKLFFLFLLGCHSLNSDYQITEVKTDGYQTIPIRNCSAFEDRTITKKITIWIHHSSFFNGYLGKNGITCFQKEAVLFETEEQANSFIDGLGLQYSRESIDGKTTAFTKE